MPKQSSQDHLVDQLLAETAVERAQAWKQVGHSIKLFNSCKAKPDRLPGHVSHAVNFVRYYEKAESEGKSADECYCDASFGALGAYLFKRVMALRPHPESIPLKQVYGTGPWGAVAMIAAPEVGKVLVQMAEKHPNMVPLVEACCGVDFQVLTTFLQASPRLCRACNKSGSCCFKESMLGIS